MRIIEAENSLQRILDALPQNIDVTSSRNSGKGNAEATRVINFEIHIMSKFAIAVKPELSLCPQQKLIDSAVKMS